MYVMCCSVVHIWALKCFKPEDEDEKKSCFGFGGPVRGAGLQFFILLAEDRMRKKVEGEGSEWNVTRIKVPYDTVLKSLFDFPHASQSQITT
jgi:hypothetical protein